MSFAVVHFLDTSEVEAVPMSWITQDSLFCHWPNFRNTSKISLAIKSASAPLEGWELHRVKIIKDHLSLEKARAGARKAEMTSDIGSESENQANKRTRHSFGASGPLLKSFSADAARNSAPIGAHFVALRSNTSDSDSDDSLFRPQPSPAKANCKAIPSTSRGLESDFHTPTRPAAAVGSTFNSDLNSTPGSVTSDKEFQKSVLRSLETIKFRQLQHEESLEIVKGYVLSLPLPVSISPDEETIDLPIKSVDYFSEIENMISTDPGVKKEMIIRLSHIGGNDEASCVRRVWSACLTDAVAANLNWAGRKGKTGIQHYSITDSLFVAVKAKFKDCSRSTFETVTKDWLKQAPSRFKLKSNAVGGI